MQLYLCHCSTCFRCTYNFMLISWYVEASWTECDPQMRLETGQNSHYFLHITNHHLFCLWHTQMILPVELSNTDYIGYTFLTPPSIQNYQNLPVKTECKVATLKWQNVLWDTQLSLFNGGGDSLTEMSVGSKVTHSPPAYTTYLLLFFTGLSFKQFSLWMMYSSLQFSVNCIMLL